MEFGKQKSLTLSRLTFLRFHLNQHFRKVFPPREVLFFSRWKSPRWNTNYLIRLTCSKSPNLNFLTRHPPHDLSAIANGYPELCFWVEDSPTLDEDDDDGDGVACPTKKSSSKFCSKSRLSFLGFFLGSNGLSGKMRSSPKSKKSLRMLLWSDDDIVLGKVVS